MDCVQVALRIRPLTQSEIEKGGRSCIERIPQMPQVAVGKNRVMFTFNQVFDENEGQRQVYDIGAKDLIDNLFKGYNLTILAYGQTGSGKTYTMGTNYSGSGEMGVIPRAVCDIFEKIENDTKRSYSVTVSFLELYNECLYDLLTKRSREESVVDLRESGSGLSIPGLSEVPVFSLEDTLAQLKEGSTGRVTGATLMNSQSSRSHAIFTINLRISEKDGLTDIMTSKFHLVDLAGSERSKKTGATGERFKEGVNINLELLVLGNVISQLGSGSTGFINYRDSKLTRLLKDSLGGNAVTLMIACVSPADVNHEETLSTLRYADRAKKIKNRPVVNQDPLVLELQRLKNENEELRLRVIGGGSLCPPEHEELHSKYSKLSTLFEETLAHNTFLSQKAVMADNMVEKMKEQMDELKKIAANSLKDTSNGVESQLMLKIKEVQEEHDKVESEIKKINSENLKPTGHQNDNENDDVVSARQAFIFNQAKLSQELMALDKNLELNKGLIQEMSVSRPALEDLVGATEHNISQLTKQLVALQEEKECLLKQVKEVSSSSNSNAAKLAEQRRLRLKEVEEKCQTLQKKVTELEKVLKMKEKNDLQIKILNKENQEMKKKKVSLINEMKKQSDHFRSLCATKDREVSRLKTKDLKRQNEMVRLERKHQLQQNVLKRKLEALAAANKRMTEARQVRQLRRNKVNQGSVLERLKEQFIQDKEVLESMFQVEKLLDSLIQDRTSLSKELSSVKACLQANSYSEEERSKMEQEVIRLKDDLEMRSAQISDLQQTLLDSKNETRFCNLDGIQTIIDAKGMLDFLVSTFKEHIKDSSEKLYTANEMKEQMTELKHELSKVQDQFTAQQKEHNRLLITQRQEFEEKINLLLEQMKNKGNQECNVTFCKGSDDKDDSVEVELSPVPIKPSVEAKPGPSKKLSSFKDAYTSFLKSNCQAIKKGRKTLSPFKANNNGKLELYNIDTSISENVENDVSPMDKTPLTRRINNLKRPALSECHLNETITISTEEDPELSKRLKYVK